MYYYRAFDLNFSADLLIPEFLPLSHRPQNIDIQISGATLEKSEDHAIFSFEVPQIANFKIQAGQHISYQIYPGVTPETLRLFLLGSCMGALLQQRGYIVLHGNAVSMDKKSASIFLGESGAGKSTLAAWYIKKNHYFLADDVCAIKLDENNLPCIIPAYPQIKLWQKSADLLNIETKNLRRIRPEEEKFSLILRDQFCTQSLPIKEIVEINHLEENCSETLTGHNKFLCLLKNIYRYSFLVEQNLMSTHNKKLLDLASKVLVRKESRYEM